MAALRITTPVGRLVGGSLYKGSTVNDKGEPYIYKSGANKGQPYSKYFIAMAIPKAPSETHFSQTAWGAQIWQLGHTAFPQQAASPLFSWKVEDGDSQIPNKKGKRNCDREGYPGHWILKFSNNFSFKVCDPKTNTYINEVDAVKLGYYVQVNFDADKNTGDTPGLYLNCNVVAFSGYGAEISVGIDLESAGFGNAPLPAGASAVPVGGFVAPPAMIAPPAALQPAYVPPVVVPNTIPMIAPTPNVAFIQVPSMPAPLPPALPVAPATPQHVMTAKANGVTYEQFKVNPQWTDALLVSEGYMLP